MQWLFSSCTRLLCPPPSTIVLLVYLTTEPEVSIVCEYDLIEVGALFLNLFDHGTAKIEASSYVPFFEFLPDLNPICA